MSQAESPGSNGRPFRPDELGIGRLFDATTDAIVIVDTGGRILLWNPSATRLFGYEPDEARGMNVDRLVPAEFLARHHAGIDRYQRTGHGAIIDSGKPYEVPAVRKDGGRVWVDLTLSPIRHEGQHYAMGILRDVTDRVQLRERKALDQKQLQDAYESLEVFASVVSHDLKEPVRGLSTYLEELEADPDSPDRADLIHRAVTSHRNLTRLLEGLLEWSRTAMTPLEPRELQLARVLADPGTSAQWEALARDKAARIEIDDDIPPILATEALVARVFGNIITNAIRHNPRRAPKVAVKRGDAPLPGHVEIVVHDNGPGFPPALIGAGRRGSEPSSLRSGFGLAITRRAVERLHGTLIVANDPDGGGAVHVHLPAPPAPRSSLDQRIRELV